ncbi:MAG: hypothetical protein [Podoviridae sp. cty5g4]|nr:MAG: hypothetical protein [Podoviridae sp. cty5g4]
MISEEEKELIIEEAKRRTLLAIPQVVGALMASQAAAHKLNTKFYSEHPEFAKRKDIVASVVEMIEGKNPLMSYEEILKLAVPEIKNKLSISDKLTMDVPKFPNRDFKNIK